MTAFKSPPKDGKVDLRPILWKQYAKLFQEFPETTVTKLTPEVLATEDGRSQAPTQLVSLHSGEIVELDPRVARWLLVKKAPGSASDFETFGPQWYCCEGGHPVGESDVPPGRDRYGQSPLAEAQQDIEHQISTLRGLLSAREQRRPQDYAPQWSQQRYRCVVPCAAAVEYEWVRLCPVITLGELFMELGNAFTAKEM